MPHTAQQLIDALEIIAPIACAESWDNVGLIVGDPSRAVRGVMLTIDYTGAVAQETREHKCDFVVAYHPPLFKPVHKVVAGGSSRLLFDALRDGIAIYSPHTALDVAPGGTNDVLADLIELRDRTPLRAIQSTHAKYCKLVTFVPEDALERVRDALFGAGAGHIGNYSQCSFRSTGKGTFFGEEGTNPTVGETGKLTTTDEIRFETILQIERTTEVVNALRTAHPYEEPAFDLIALTTPSTGLGQGRKGFVPEGATVEMLVNRLKRELDIDRVLLAGDKDKIVRRAAVCAGSCGDLLDDAIAARVDLYLTGEMKHHDALKAVSAGVNVVCLLHSNSERAILKSLVTRLAHALPGLPCHVSKEDRDPFCII